MYGYGYYGWGMDPTILLLVIGMLLSLAASAKLRSTFAVYKKVRSHSGITGAEAAQRILRAAGIQTYRWFRSAEVLRITMIRERKRFPFQKIFMEEILWRLWGWQHMNVAMRSRMRSIMHH